MLHLIDFFFLCADTLDRAFRDILTLSFHPSCHALVIKIKRCVTMLVRVCITLPKWQKAKCCAISIASLMLYARYEINAKKKKKKVSLSVCWRGHYVAISRFRDKRQEWRRIAGSTYQRHCIRTIHHLRLALQRTLQLDRSGWRQTRYTFFTAS